METIDLIVFGICMIIAFDLGASMGKEKKVKTLNPIKIIEEKRKLKKVEELIQHQDEIDKTIADNIDNYDGTGNGQKDIPR